MMTKNWLQGAKYEVRSILGIFPSIYFPLLRLKPKRYRNAVHPKTEIVVEGFPRSGNTFAVAAFIIAQNRKPSIAHHLHVPAQIARACELGIPTILLVRAPIDAVTSLLLRQPFTSPEQALRSYIRYYEKTKLFLDNVVIGNFDKVTSNFGQIIKLVNHRYNTNFNVFLHTDENLKKCYKLIEEMDMADTGKKTVSEITVARPSNERDNLKHKLQQDMNFAKLHSLIDRAQKLYDEFKI